MRNLIVTIVLLLVCVVAYPQVAPATGKASSKPNVTITDKGYVAIGKAKADSATALTYTDSKGKVFPVYRSSRGSDYVVKTSKKTGKTYRYYMKSK